MTGLKIVLESCENSQFIYWHEKYFFLYARILYEKSILYVSVAVPSEGTIQNPEKDLLLLREALGIVESTLQHDIGAINVLNAGLLYYNSSTVRVFLMISYLL